MIKIPAKFKNGFMLSLILLLGFMLRAYNMNFPSIGYHNMKENDALSIAQEMERTGDFITRRVYFLDAFDEEPKARYYPQPPLVPYQTLLAWRAFGDNLWGPRLINIIFGVMSILVIYFMGRILFNDFLTALFSAFLLAVMPLAVFFSRNIQPESPAFFFMILGSLFYLKFISSSKKRNLLFGGLAFVIAWLYKMSFLVGIVPFLFCIPLGIFRKEKISKIVKDAIFFLLPYLIIVFAIMWLRHTGEWEFRQSDTLGRIKISEIFTQGYWQKNGRAIWQYTKDENFTPVFLTLSVLGIIFALFKRKYLAGRYIIGWLFTLIPYCMVFSDFINQHNYYQMPFLILACISAAYAVWSLSDVVTIKNVTRKNFLISMMILASAISASFVYNSVSRMHGTVFLGLDIAGESIRELTKPEERVFLMAHSQSRGIGRYARRYMDWPKDFEDFKSKEEKLNIRYVCVYPAEFAFMLKTNTPEWFEYIQGNYHVKEVGVTEEPGKIYYVILERGKGSDPATFLKEFSGAKQLRTIYRVLGKLIFFYTLRIQAEESGGGQVEKAPKTASP